jgi:hypothetical protein
MFMIFLGGDGMGWLASDGGGIDWQPRLHAISEQT